MLETERISTPEIPMQKYVPRCHSPRLVTTLFCHTPQQLFFHTPHTRRLTEAHTCAQFAIGTHRDASPRAQAEGSSRDKDGHFGVLAHVICGPDKIIYAASIGGVSSGGDNPTWMSSPEGMALETPVDPTTGYRGWMALSEYWMAVDQAYAHRCWQMYVPSPSAPPRVTRTCVPVLSFIFSSFILIMPTF